MSRETNQPNPTAKRVLDNLREIGRVIDEHAAAISGLEEDEQGLLVSELLTLIDWDDAEDFDASLADISRSLEAGEALDLSADRLREKEKSSRRRRATYQKGEHRRDICEINGVNYDEVRSSMRDGFSKRFRTRKKAEDARPKATGNSQKNMSVRERRQMESMNERSGSSDD